MKKRLTKKIKIDKKQNSNVFFTVDSPGWRKPEELDIGSLREMLDVDTSANVIAYEFKNQDKFPELPPNAHKLEGSLEVAADDNYLYVWIVNRWKRIPLTEF